MFLGALLFGLFALAYLHAQVRRPASFDGVSSTSSSTSRLGPGGAGSRGDKANAAPALPRMPGLIEANRRRLAKACIAGTVGHRRSNGWVQAVEDDQPRRCIATTQ